MIQTDRNKRTTKMERKMSRSEKKGKTLPCLLFMMFKRKQNTLYSTPIASFDRSMFAMADYL